MSSDSIPQESAQTYYGRRAREQIQLAKFLSEQEKKIDTDPEEMMHILKNKRESITTLWSENYFTHPSTRVYKGEGKTPQDHWASEMAKLNRMIQENERKTSAKTSNNAGPTNNTTNNASVLTGGSYNNCSFTVAAPAAAAAAPSIESASSGSSENLADIEKDVPGLVQDPAILPSTANNTDGQGLPDSADEQQIQKLYDSLKIIKDPPHGLSAKSLAAYHFSIRDFVKKCILVDKMSSSEIWLQFMDLGEASSEISSRITGHNGESPPSQSKEVIKIMAKLVTKSNNQTKHYNRLPQNTRDQVSEFLTNMFDNLQKSEGITNLSPNDIKEAKEFIEMCVATSPNSRSLHFHNKGRSNSQTSRKRRRTMTPGRQEETIDNLRTQLSNTEGLLAREQRRSAKLYRSLSSEKRRSAKLRRSLSSEKHYSAELGRKLSSEKRYSTQLEDDNDHLRRECEGLSRQLFGNRR